MTHDRPARRPLHRLSIVLVILGTLLLGYWVWAHTDRWLAEQRAEAELDQLLAASSPSSPSAPPSPGVPDIAGLAGGEGEPLPDHLPGEERDDAGDEAVDAGDETIARPSPPPKPPTPSTPPMGRLEIPRLGLSAIVMPGTGRRTLRRAVGHIEGTARPGEPGTVGLAGHRDSHFRPLEGIAPGDEIVLTTPAGRFRYQVGWTEIVQPHEVEVLAARDAPYLALVTCYPFDFLGDAPERFIVQARQVGGPQPPA